MKKRKKYVMVIICGCIIAAYGIRFYYLNSSVPVSNTKSFQKGEEVPFEKDYTISADERIDGYTVKVLESKILPVKEFYTKYNLMDTTLLEDVFTKYYYLVKVSFANKDNQSGTKSGVNLTQIVLAGTNYYMVVDSQVLSLLNPDLPGMGFSLRPNSNKEVYLPYAVIPSTHTDYAGFKKDPPKLQITEYPNRKIINVQ